MITPPHITIVEQLPHWNKNHNNSCKQKIKSIMKKYNYDEEDIDSIDNRFCEGWQIARDIAIELLKKKYYENKCIWGETSKNQIIPDNHKNNNISIPTPDKQTTRYCPICGKIIMIKTHQKGTNNMTDQEFQEFLEQNREKIHKIIPTDPAIAKDDEWRDDSYDE